MFCRGTNALHPARYAIVAAVLERTAAAPNGCDPSRGESEALTTVSQAAGHADAFSRGWPSDGGVRLAQHEHYMRSGLVIVVSWKIRLDRGSLAIPTAAKGVVRPATVEAGARVIMRYGFPAPSSRKLRIFGRV